MDFNVINVNFLSVVRCVHTRIIYRNEFIPVNKPVNAFYLNIYFALLYLLIYFELSKRQNCPFKKKKQLINSRLGCVCMCVFIRLAVHACNQQLYDWLELSFIQCSLFGFRRKALYYIIIKALNYFLK